MDWDAIDLDAVERERQDEAVKAQKWDEKVAALALSLAADLQEHIDALIKNLIFQNEICAKNLKYIISSCPCPDARKEKALKAVASLVSGGVGSDGGDKVRWLADVLTVFARVKLLEETAEAEARGQTGADMKEREQIFIWASQQPRKTIEQAMFSLTSPDKILGEICAWLLRFVKGEKSHQQRVAENVAQSVSGGRPGRDGGGAGGSGPEQGGGRWGTGGRGGGAGTGGSGSGAGAGD
jgi:hypothetical protein